MVMTRPLTLSISSANHKMGAVPSVSLPPGASCPDDVPCLQSCYARRHMYELAIRPNIRRAWDRNLLLWESDPERYFACIRAHLTLDPDPHFRFHVGGDIPSFDYLQRMLELAHLLPRTTFLCFSKRYEWLLDIPRPPRNLRLVVSAWPHLEMPSALAGRYAIAWMQDGRESRVPARAHRCIGRCSHCFSCWNLGAGDHIVFQKH